MLSQLLNLSTAVEIYENLTLYIHSHPKRKLLPGNKHMQPQRW